jgi:hypothetical protein
MDEENTGKSTKPSKRSGTTGTLYRYGSSTAMDQAQEEDNTPLLPF